MSIMVEICIQDTKKAYRTMSEPSQRTAIRLALKKVEVVSMDTCFKALTASVLVNLIIVISLTTVL